MAWTWGQTDIDGLKRLLEQNPTFPTFLNYLAGRKPGTRTVELRDIQRATSLPYNLVLEFGRAMGGLSFCELFTGRKGYATRLQFYNVSAAEVGQKAVEEGQAQKAGTLDAKGTTGNGNSFSATDIAARISDHKRSLATALGVDLQAIHISVEMKGQVLISA